LDSQGVSIKKAEENATKIPTETEENADRLAEQMAKATLNSEEKKT
jgi:hypothetical protein